MSKKLFDCEQVSAIFIKMGAKGMSERVTGEFLIPAKSFAVLHKFIRETGRAVGRISLSVRWEKPVFGFSTLEPISSKQIQGIL